MTINNIISVLFKILLLSTNIFLAIHVWNINLTVNSLVGDYIKLQKEVDSYHKDTLVK